MATDMKIKPNAARKKTCCVFAIVLGVIGLIFLVAMVLLFAGVIPGLYLDRTAIT